MKKIRNKQWFLPAFVIIGVLSLFIMSNKSGAPANAHEQMGNNTAGGIQLIGLQIERDKYGLAMVDTINQTLWIYELNSRGSAHNRLKLLAARSWRYDRLLEDLNTAEPKPKQVKMLLESLGMQQKTDDKPQADSEANNLDVTSP